MTEKRFYLDENGINDREYEFSVLGEDELVDIINGIVDENEQLKQFPIKLDNRIQKLEEDLKALKEMDKSDLNPQSVEDVATVIGMSLNALMQFRKELKGDVE